MVGLLLVIIAVVALVILLLVALAKPGAGQNKPPQQGEAPSR